MEENHLKHFYKLYQITVPEDGESFHHSLIGSFAVINNELYITSDYHGWIRNHIGHGLLTPEILNNIKKIKNSQYFDLVSEHDIQNLERPSLLPELVPENNANIEPEVNIDDKSAARPPSKWHYYRVDHEEPATLEFKDGELFYNGFKTTPSEQQWIYRSLKTGAGSLQYASGDIDKNKLRKMEEVLYKAMDPVGDDSRYHFDKILQSQGEKTDSSQHAKIAQVFDNKIKPLFDSGVMDQESYDTIRKAAFEDPMCSGIGNKSSYYAHLNSVANNRIRGTHISIDGNNFKHINDSLSHQAGDEAIRMFGRAFRNAVDKGIGRENAKIHRPGGDEFSIFVRESPGESEEEHIGKVHKLLRDLRTETQAQLSEAYPALNSRHKLSFSAGIGKSPFSAEESLKVAKEAKKASGQPIGQHDFHFHSNEGLVPVPAEIAPLPKK